MKWFVVGLIRLYRIVLSPLKGRPTCRFVPTCSEYALEAVRTRGVAVGSAKALWRICRCNPLFEGGYDPVCGNAPEPGGDPVAANGEAGS